MVNNGGRLPGKSGVYHVISKHGLVHFISPAGNKIHPLSIPSPSESPPPLETLSPATPAGQPPPPVST